MSERWRTLVIDEDEQRGCELQDALRAAGSAALTCTSSEEALMLMESVHLDAAVIDVSLPSAEEGVLLGWIKTHRPEMRLVLISTGDTEELTRWSDVAHGHWRLVRRPLSERDLVSILDRMRTHRGFSAALHHLELVDFLQMLAFSRMKAVVTIQATERHRAELFLEEGQIVFASCEGLQGEEAIRRCLHYQSGRITTEPWRKPPTRTMHRSLEYILLDSLLDADDAPLHTDDSSLHTDTSAFQSDDALFSLACTEDLVGSTP